MKVFILTAGRKALDYAPSVHINIAAAAIQAKANHLTPCKLPVMHFTVSNAKNYFYEARKRPWSWSQ
jgi:hypothetical protein